MMGILSHNTALASHNRNNKNVWYVKDERRASSGRLIIITRMSHNTGSQKHVNITHFIRPTIKAPSFRPLSHNTGAQILSPMSTGSEGPPESHTTSNEVWGRKLAMKQNESSGLAMKGK